MRMPAGRRALCNLGLGEHSNLMQECARMQGLDFDVDCWLSREEYPMTIHVVLPTANQASVVWVTDRLAGFGLGSALDTEKIRYLRDHKIACSAWGNKAFLIRD